MKKLLSSLPLLYLIACGSTEQPSEDQVQLFKERFRPQYHFTPPSQWMNDPNGMVFYEGEYHLFYQFYPDSNVWGPMHWGHAVSDDMITWEHLPVALEPDSLGYIFSGSAVIDWENTSGLSSGQEPPMIAIFTYHDPVGAEAETDTFQTQGIAYSLDRGRNWIKYANNPVLDNPGIIDFRDPKVMWHEEKGKWIMILAVKDHINIYSSPDLLSWTLESEFGHTIGGHGGVWECPDLFALEDESGNKKWIMLVSINPGGPQGGSATQYFVGDFDGGTFVPADTTTRWIDLGADNYAGVTWSDIPEEDGRRLFIGWMSNWQYAQEVPTTEWRSAMTLPRELLLTEANGQPILKSRPVKEISQYLTQQQVNGADGLYELENDLAMVEITNISQNQLKIILSNKSGEEVAIHISEEEVSIDRTVSGMTDFHEDFGAVHRYENFLEKLEKIQLYVDRSSVELFINDGALVMTDLVFPTNPYSHVKVSPAQDSVSIFSVASIW